MTNRFAPEELRSLRARLVMVVVFLAWVVPTYVISALVHNRLPALLGLFVAVWHLALIVYNQYKADKQRRRDFWAGRASIERLPERSVWTEIRTSGRR